jgi:hypothetical protein
MARQGSPNEMLSKAVGPDSGQVSDMCSPVTARIAPSAPNATAHAGRYTARPRSI